MKNHIDAPSVLAAKLKRQPGRCGWKPTPAAPSTYSQLSDTFRVQEHEARYRVQPWCRV
jgi:hypothetical protein